VAAMTIAFWQLTLGAALLFLSLNLPISEAQSGAQSGLQSGE
jgi:hypothetical protein